MMRPTMRVAPLRPFGAEVTGIDLATLSGDRAPEMRALIARARVVVFRDQHIDDDAFVRFLRTLGDVTFTEGETPVPHAPDLNVVSNVGRTTPPRSVFHTDTSYVARPPAFTALRPVLLPQRGGYTVFSDQVAVARGLPRKVRVALRGRTVVHRATGIDGALEARRHPLFRRNPETGEVALYLSTPERCHDLSDVDARTSERAIAALYRRSIRPSALYRHAWRPGDVLVWDNRATMHRADHDGVDGDRVLHRGMVLGEEPIPG